MKSITGTSNNVEFIDYTVSTSGTYRLKIYQYGKPGTTDYVAMSYVIRWLIVKTAVINFIAAVYFLRLLVFR